MFGTTATATTSTTVSVIGREIEIEIETSVRETGDTITMTGNQRIEIREIETREIETRETEILGTCEIRAMFEIRTTVKGKGITGTPAIETCATLGTFAMPGTVTREIYATLGI
jgi:hypothetical protein